jgi:hypothetical protein
MQANNSPFTRQDLKKVEAIAVKAMQALACHMPPKHILDPVVMDTKAAEIAKASYQLAVFMAEEHDILEKRMEEANKQFKIKNEPLSLD